MQAEVWSFAMCNAAVPSTTCAHRSPHMTIRSNSTNATGMLSTTTSATWCAASILPWSLKHVGTSSVPCIKVMPALLHLTSSCLHQVHGDAVRFHGQHASRPSQCPAPSRAIKQPLEGPRRREAKKIANDLCVHGIGVGRESLNNRAPTLTLYYHPWWLYA